MTIRATSIAAYRSTDRDKRCEEVLAVMTTRADWTLFEIAEAMGVPDHWISGRLTELKNKKKIQLVGFCRKNPSTGKSCNVVRIA